MFCGGVPTLFGCHLCSFNLKCACFYLPLITVVSWKRAVYVQDTGFYSRCWLCHCIRSFWKHSMCWLCHCIRSSWKHIIFCTVQPTDGAILPSLTVYTTALATYLLLQETYIFLLCFVLYLLTLVLASCSISGSNC